MTADDITWIIIPCFTNILWKIQGKKFLKFFPIGRALALQEAEAEAEEFNEKLLERIEKLEKQLVFQAQQQEKLSKQTNEQLRTISEEIKTLKDKSKWVGHLFNTIQYNHSDGW